ncbi:MAG: SDR family oxidoreductase [Myxococcales bacterium]|nr:SDR family oxidoreductase [Polyangiaceae bacterium]MDW8248307.1 SDR family oxidoreductase [Myxococcales bacterium]
MPRPGYDEVLLITGYPTFGARQLVALALRTQPSTFLYALAAPEQMEAAQEHAAALSPDARERFELLEGTTTHIDLGLSGAEVRRICTEVDRIHHMEQLTHPSVDKESATRVNVRGTLEVLELARSCHQLKALVYHSTAFVAGDRTGKILEDELDKHQRFRNPVEETKAIAERLVRAAMRSIPAMILRPTLVVGDSQSGEVDQLEGPYLALLLILSTPPEMAVPLPRSDNPLHMIPVDYMVQAALALGRDSRAIGKTFHLADPKCLSADRVFEILARAAGRRIGGALPTAFTQALLRAPGLTRLVRSPRAFLDQILTPVCFDTSHTDQLLHGTGIVCPPFESYVDRLVAYVRARYLVETSPDTGRPSLDLDADDLP